MRLFYYFTINLLCINFLLGTTVSKVLADETKVKAEVPGSIPNKPKKPVQHNTPIAVIFEGTDSIGSKLSTQIKELMNASNLFTLTEKDTPKIRIIISTKSEFSQRPGIGSVYTIVWLFSQSDTTLKHYLLHEVGLVTADEVNQIAAKIVEQTDNLSIRYNYLLQ